MGALTLPPAGPVYVDADGIIYTVEKIEPYASLLAPLWTAAQSSGLPVVTSELTWLETLAGPIKSGSAALAAVFRAFLTAREITLAPVTLAIWEQAAGLRALGLKTPDAVHAATALTTGCTLFLTNDPAFRRVPGLTVAVLRDILAA